MRRCLYREHGRNKEVVMAGLVPGSHGLAVMQRARRGCPAMTVTFGTYGYQRSSVNTGDFDREQQTIILLFSAFSSSLRKESR